MDIQSQYSDRLEKVEDYLRGILPRQMLLEWMERITGEPGGVVPAAAVGEIVAPALDLLERGGKRWRPVLMLISCELFGGGDSVAPLTPLVELAHNGSLIVDDIEDNADTRRGGPAIHRIYGRDTAINSGNLLYFLPTLLIEEFTVDATLRAALHSEYCTAMRRLHIGQGLDIAWHNNPETVPPEESYLYMCRYKTGSLSRFAARAGIMAACSAPVRERRAEVLSRACEEAGVAFQILDDVRNLTTGNPGKMRGDDIVEGKKSLPFIYAAADSRAAGALLECFAGIRKAGGRDRLAYIERAVAVMQDTDAIRLAEAKAREILCKNIDRIEGAFPPTQARHVLIYMLNGFVDGPAAQQS